jgi:uncharacterized protein YndB with AHSA1/START domain
MTDTEFTITRVFDAPPELVFKAWTDPDQFARWWGSDGTTTPRETTRLDVRPGGEWSARMRSDADGAEHPFAGVYREIVENERLVMTISEGDRPDPDREHVMTVTFADLGGSTEMVFTQAGDFSEFTQEQFEGLEGGWGQFFDRLAAAVA